jgi:hypothetical protein
VNIKDVADQIEKKAGVSILSLPVGRRFMTRAPDGQMVMIKAGEPWPIGKTDGSIVISLFQSDDDVRVYTLAAESETGKEPAPPTRYTISKHQPAIFAEIMAIETFIDEIANEWVVVDEGISSAERERSAVLEFLKQRGNLPVTLLVSMLEAEDHLDKDEDDEPEGVVTSAPANPAAAAS